MQALARKDVLPIIIVLTGLTFLTLVSLSQAMAGFRFISGAIDSRSINMGAQGPQSRLQEITLPGRMELADKQGPACGSMKKKSCDMMDKTDHEAMMKDGKWQDIQKIHKNIEGFDHGLKNQGMSGIELKQTL